MLALATDTISSRIYRLFSKLKKTEMEEPEIEGSETEEQETKVPETDSLADGFAWLPLELILMILSYLSTPSLVSFGATSKRNFYYHVICVRKLHLAVFSKALDAEAAFIMSGLSDKPEDIDEQRQTNQIKIILPEGYTEVDPMLLPHEELEQLLNTEQVTSEYIERGVFYDKLSIAQTIRTQNEKLVQMVRRYGSSLIELEFLATTLNDEGAMALGARCGAKLRHLGLRFHYIHPRFNIPLSYWPALAPASPAWNFLIGIGPAAKGLGMDNLQSLVLERAGITTWQLQMLIKRNRNLEVLKLRACAAANMEFVRWLGGIDIPDDEGGPSRQDGEAAPGATLKVLWIENCQEVTRDVDFLEKCERIDAGLEWVRGLVGLRVSDL